MDKSYWWEFEGWRHELAPYVVLVSAFIEHRLTGAEFEVMFLKLYKTDPTKWEDELFRALDGLFAAVDDYCADPRILEEVGGLDEAGMRSKGESTLRELRAIPGSHRL
ncbi:hypothetical protein Sru01_22120 [Sphaerisporangium rufum]|uniref:Colicin D immunity protein domain-containing protein n=1 Tax=Sphaerisporangium rufum TaxID=1381558 RepID=A0A919R2L1_9ACTN|nr:hypothetical protein Sru01_22120 [Sphaerisporangium rufum]